MRFRLRTLMVVFVLLAIALPFCMSILVYLEQSRPGPTERLKADPDVNPEALKGENARLRQLIDEYKKRLAAKKQRENRLPQD